MHCAKRALHKRCLMLLKIILTLVHNIIASLMGHHKITVGDNHYTNDVLCI